MIAPRRARSLPELGPPFLGLVALEFLLGMTLNLFVDLPRGSLLGALVSSPWLDLHVLVALMLLGISVTALRFALATRRRPPVLVCALGLLSGLGAILAGLAFVAGEQSPWASFVMSVGLLGLLLEAGYLLSLRGGVRVAPPAPGSPDHPLRVEGAPRERPGG